MSNGETSSSGFTTIELVVVLLIVGILAAVTLPKLTSGDGVASAAFRDEVLAALRLAQKSAVSHRRLVCAEIATTTVTLKIAAANPASTCGAVTLPGPGGTAAYATSTSGATVSASPAGPLYFQPDGTVTSDGAGTTPQDFTVTVAGETAITIVGATGHVG